MRSISTWVLIFTIVSVFSPVGPGRPAAASGTHAERLTAIDGDTLDLNGRAIELTGIDAPELGQWCLDGDTLYACGLEAAFELHKILTLEPVTCIPAGTQTDRYECATADSSLSVLMVENGLAVATKGMALQSAEEKARHVPLGIWRGRFVSPADWRNGARLPEERANAENCPVLAMDLYGVHVYLTPTDADYDTWQARTDAIKERFCSDEAARAQGYAHFAAAAGHAIARD